MPKIKLPVEIFKKVGSSLLLFSLFLAIYIIYRLKIAPFLNSKVSEEIGKYFLSFLVVIIGFFLQRVVSGILSYYSQLLDKERLIPLNKELIPLIQRGAKIVIWVLALLIILPLFGINISGLITTLGVSSLAIALAAQDTIANIISGFMIMVDRPFRIGDRIKLPSGEEVKVLEVGVRRSKFLSLDNKSVIVLPNLELSKSKIINYTYAQGLEKKNYG
ncbi:MAG: mechanosensitive ion channel [Candidatus Omnitrophica bacterium]|nr:mechanosensitive ion channel [Candidatus Omnitrophota bacterium]